MTLGLGKDGDGGRDRLAVLRIIPGCEKVLRGQLEASRQGKLFIEFITGPTFLPVCLPWELIASSCIMLNALPITFS